MRKYSPKACFSALQFLYNTGEGEVSKQLAGVASERFFYHSEAFIVKQQCSNLKSVNRLMLGNTYIYKVMILL